jgi:hypothetical protein
MVVPEWQREHLLGAEVTKLELLGECLLEARLIAL